MNIEIDDRDQAYDNGIDQLPEVGPYKISVKNQVYQIDEFKRLLQVLQIDLDNLEITEKEKTWTEGGQTYTFFTIFQNRDDAIKLLEASNTPWKGSVIKPRYQPMSERVQHYANDAAEKQQVHFNRNQLGANLANNDGNRQSGPTLFQRGSAIQESGASKLFQRGVNIQQDKLFSRDARGADVEKFDRPKLERGTHISNKNTFSRGDNLKSDNKKFSKGNDNERDDNTVRINLKRG